MSTDTSGTPVTLLGGPSFQVQAQDTLLQAALRAGIGFPYECNAGGCGSCKFELLDGELRTLWEQAPGLSPRDRQKGRRLACQSVPLGPVTARLRLDPACVPAIRPLRQRATLTRVDEVTHDMRQFSFSTAGPAAFLAGQYALLQFPALGIQRAYSMSNLPNPQGEWQFIVRRVPQGAGTGQLFEQLRPGDALAIDGPYGMAWLRPPERDLLCIAGGSGLAPMLSIARAAAPLLRAAGRRLHFYLGARTPADRAAQALLAALPEYGELLQCEEVVSQPPPPEAGRGAWTGPTGLVHEAVDARFGDRLAAHEVYFAGPPPMAQALMDLLMVRRAVPFQQIHFDRFF
jgi:toluene monooxygenase electron transfer component